MNNTTAPSSAEKSSHVYQEDKIARDAEKEKLQAAPPATGHEDDYQTSNEVDTGLEERRQTSLHGCGKAVIDRSSLSLSHRAAQQASRAMGRAAGYEDDYEMSSEEETTPSYLPKAPEPLLLGSQKESSESPWPIRGKHRFNHGTVASAGMEQMVP